jgi:hypothetical protein
MLEIPAFGSWRQKDPEFEARLSYMAGHYLNTNPNFLPQNNQQNMRTKRM